MKDGLHMVELRLPERELLRYAGKLGLGWHPRRGRLDTGYLLHCVLRAGLGDLAPQPFVEIEEARGGGGLCVLGYTRASTEQLHAALAGAGELRALIGPALRSKRMPTEWPQGLLLDFEARVCPVVRMSSDGPFWKKGTEVDAFLRACWRQGADVPVDRQVVYAEWLSERLRRGGAVPVDGPILTRFGLTRLLRRTQGRDRKGHTVQRPDAWLRGTLRVEDPRAFTQLVETGIGRHRAFGFGMLLLRPSRAASARRSA